VGVIVATGTVCTTETLFVNTAGSPPVFRKNSQVPRPYTKNTRVMRGIRIPPSGLKIDNNPVTGSFPVKQLLPYVSAHSKAVIFACCCGSASSKNAKKQLLELLLFPREYYHNSNSRVSST
jgi:hypothetical protein